MNTKLWARYWIEPGIKVVHRELYSRCLMTDKLTTDTDMLELVAMRVNDIKRKKFNGFKGSTIIGIECRWIDTELKPHERIFRSNELLPYDICAKGNVEVEKWINRNTDG